MIKLDFNKDLTNFQIQNICNQVGIKLNGIYMKDELSSNISNGNYIVNLQNHNEEGSHWVCFLKSKNNIYWFDSFGCPPMQNEVNIFKQNHYNVYYSSVQIQSMTSILCGFFCIAYLYFVNLKGSSTTHKIAEFQNLFNYKNRANNDNILKNLYKHIIIQ